MVFEPDTYSESWTITENIIVEPRREFFLQNRDKTAGQMSAVGTPCPYCEQRFGSHLTLFYCEITLFCAKLALLSVV
jgi:hypothetical protein